MPTCKDCAHVRVGYVDPARGICTAKREELKEITSVTVSGKTVKMSDQACEMFKDKSEVDRKTHLRTGF